MKKFYLPLIFSLFLLATSHQARGACPVTISAGGPTLFCNGDSVLLTASAGTGYIYSWYRNGNPVPGGTSQTYYAKTTGYYTVNVMVASPFCASSSNYIDVTVEVPLTVTISSLGTMLCSASADLMEVSPSSSLGLYQWYEDTLALPLANEYQYNAGHNATYYCAVTNTCGSYLSAPFLLNNPMFNFWQFGSIEAAGPTSFCSGANVLLQQSNSMSGGISLQWYRDGVAIPGATGSNYMATQGGNYMLRQYNYCDQQWPFFPEFYFYSNIIRVTLLPGSVPTASITAGGPTTFCGGSNVTLSAATGTGWSFQWRQNNVDISGETASTYLAQTTGSYTCVVSNTCGSFVSNAISTLMIPAGNFVTIFGSSTICPGGSVTLNSSSAGSGGSYQWQLNSSNIVGATSQSYAATAQGIYTCSITNTCGTFLSPNSITITVSTSCATGLEFDGSNDFATVPNSSAYAFGTGNFTIEAWVNLHPSQNFYPTIISLHNISSANAGFVLYFSSGKLRLDLAGQSAGGGNGADLRDNTCHHVAVSRTGPNTIKFYVDGNLVGTSAPANYNATANGVLQIGRDLYYGPSNFHGKMMEVRMWNIARTQSEIIMDRDDALTGSEPGLVGYWKLNDGSGQVINDYSPTNNDGQLGQFSTVDVSDPIFATACPLAGCAIPVASISVMGTGNTHICASSSLILDAGTVPGMSYQWKRNGVNIAGATGRYYQATLAGSYTCLVSNSCLNSTLSNAITITVDSSCYNGLYFDGVDDVVTIPGDTVFNVDSIFSIEAWIRDDASMNDSTVEPIISNWGPTNTSGIRLNVVNGRLTWSDNLSLGPDLRDGACHSIRATHTAAGYWYLFVDGTNIYQAPSGANITSTLPLLIGAGLNSMGGADHFKGFIREIRFWNTSVSGSDMDNPLGITLSPSLAGNWRFNEGAGQTATDYSIYANPGVLGVTGSSETQDPTWSSGCPPCPIPSATISAGGPVAFCFGSNVSLNASPTGAGYTYQWRRNGALIPGATFASYVATTTGAYDVLISNNNCSSFASVIQVTVNGGLSTFTLQPNGTTGTDAMVSNLSGDEAVNYGSGTDLNADAWVQNSGNAQRSFLRFDLGSLPVNTLIQQAVLTLYNNPTASLPGGPADALPGNHYRSLWVRNTSWLQKVTAPWNEGTITWNNQPPATTLDQVTLWYSYDPHQDYAIDVTRFVQEMIASPATNYGWKLRLQNETFWASLLFASSDYPDSTKWPKLTITYYDTTASIAAAGPTSICTGSSVTLNATPSSGVTYQWKLNGTNIGGATASSYAATASGNYTCLITSACNNATSNAITVTFASVPPPATITPGGSTTVCTGASVTLNVNTGAGLSYQWQLNSVNIGGATASSYSANAAGNYTCVVTNSCGISTSNILTITIIPPPTASITAGGSTTFCSGGSVTLSANTGTGLTYQWSRNGGAVGGATSSSYSATTSGNYTCTVTNPCGNTSSNSIAVTVNTAPPATITAGGSTTFCSGGSVTFTANTGTGLSYQWKLNAVNIGGATSSSYTASVAGNYVCVVTNSCGSTTSNNFVVTVNALPSASITAGGPITFCTGGSVTLNANTGAGLTYQWKLNGSNISGATASSYSATAAGNFTCVVTNSCGNTTSNTIAVTVNAVPAATITAGGPTTFCPGGSVTLNANTGTGLSYQWLLNGSNVAGATSSSYLANAAGNYSCAVTNTCGSTTSNTIGVIVNSTPPAATITAGGSTNICTGGSVTLNANTGTGLSYQWMLNGGNIAGATSSSYLAGAAGNYSCAVTNTCGSTTSNTIAVTVDTAPAAAISAGGSTTFCTGGSVTLNANTGTGLTYQWKLNGSNIIGAIASSYAATAAGNYTCVVTNLCGSTTSNAIGVTINPAPTATITAGGPTTFCSGGSVTLTANTGAGLSWQWMLNGGNITGATSSAYQANAAGNYSCAVTNTCGSTTSNSITVTVNTAPTATISAGGATSFCTGGSVTLNANTGTGLTYQWKLNGSNIAGAVSSFYNATATGNYTCVVTNSCGSATSNSISITVITLPSATITAGGSTVFCTGGSVTLNANAGTGLSYQWKLNGSNIAGAASNAYAATATGNYTCEVTNTCGSATSNTISVTVNSLPTATITAGGNTTFCNGGSVTLNANTGTGLTYQWKLNGSNIGGATSSSYAATAAGNYTGVVTNSCGNATSNTIAVTVNTPPPATITAGGSTTFCNGGSVTLNANTGTGLTYQWKLNGSNIAGAASFSYTAGTPGNYTCELTNSCGTTGSNSIAVTVLSLPITPGAITGLASGICGNTTDYSVGAVAGASTYNWTVPGGVIINSGQGTSAINIIYPIPFSSGSISVNAENTCGTSGSASLALTSVLAPAGLILGLTDVCEMKTYVYSIAPVEGATNYTWTVPTKARVQHGQGTATAEIKMNRYAGNITVTASNSCTSSATSVLAVTLTNVGCGPVHRDVRALDAEVYPNPFSTEFTLKIYSDDDSKCQVILRDMTGRILEQREQVAPGAEISFGNHLACGIYLAEVIQAEERVVLRVVKSE